MGDIIEVTSPNIIGKDPNDAWEDETYKDRLEEAERIYVDQRRDEQKRINHEIGEGKVDAPPTCDLITLDEAVERFVLVADGKRVVDRKYPTYSLGVDEWKLMHRASFDFFEGRKVFVADEWLADKRRITVLQRTFKAGANEFTNDPNGQRSINTWKGFKREGKTSAHLQLFLKHIEFLFPDKSARERFLNWLAHIEQVPSVLPHTAWLHIAPSTGMGRNWLASVLTRVWAGRVASNFNLVGTLNSDFNGRLSGKLLAIVDEIREGGNDQWKHSEKMKSLVTEEVRTINPKYGRTSVEFNSCRWLIFSNHLSAMPLQNSDRRIEVVVNSGEPQSEAYYGALYKALDDDAFINSVSVFLKHRDISKFNAGGHAIWSDDKLKVANANKSDVTETLELLIEYWSADLITTSALLEVLNYDETHQGYEKITPVLKRCLEDLGIERLERRMQIGGKKQYVYCLRNLERWSAASTEESVSNAKSKCCPVSESISHKGAGDFLYSIIDDKK